MWGNNSRRSSHDCRSQNFARQHAHTTSRIAPLFRRWPHLKGHELAELDAALWRTHPPRHASRSAAARQALSLVQIQRRAALTRDGFSAAGGRAVIGHVSGGVRG